jgi:hypothetical protein
LKIIIENLLLQFHDMLTGIGDKRASRTVVGFVSLRFARVEIALEAVTAMTCHNPISQEIVKQLVFVGHEVIDFELPEYCKIGFAIETAVDATTFIAPVYFPIGPFGFGHGFSFVSKRAVISQRAIY